jgi:hypothetical protein
MNHGTGVDFAVGVGVGVVGADWDRDDGLTSVVMIDHVYGDGNDP